jgi:hypothetical protein
LFIDVVGELFFGLRPRVLGVRRSDADKYEQQDFRSEPDFCGLHGGIFARQAHSRNFSTSAVLAVMENHQIV